MLLAPLAEAAGGWGLCRATKADKPATVFADRNDPGYQKLLAMVLAGQDFLTRQSTRFDLSNFRPRVDWVREMKRFEILPEGMTPLAPINVYEAERKYWRSLWYKPLAWAANVKRPE